MLEIDLMIQRAKKHLYNLRIVLSECATHPFHNSNAHVQSLVDAIVYASHPNQLFKTDLDGKPSTVKTNLDVKSMWTVEILNLTACIFSCRRYCQMVTYTYHLVRNCVRYK